MIKKVIILSCVFLNFSFFSAFAQTKPTTVSFLQTGWYFIVKDGEGIKMKLDNDSTYFFVNPKPILTIKNIDSLSINQNGNEMYFLLMKFDKKGSHDWYLATLRSINLRLAFIFDNNLLYTPKVNSEIIDGIAILAGKNYSKERLENIMALMEKEKK